MVKAEPVVAPKPVPVAEPESAPLADREAVDTVMARESALAAALENARSYHRDGIQLVLFDSARQPLLELRQTDWD